MQDITEKDVARLKDELGSVIDIGENGEVIDSILSLLSMPDEDFAILAPGVMQSYQQSINNVEDKIALVHGFNAAGLKADDLIAAFAEVDTQIDQMAIPAIKKDFLKELLSSIVNAVNETEGIAKRLIKVPIEICNENAKLPEYAHMTDSGMDVFAIEDITIHPGETVLVPTGIKVALPVGYELQVRPKSGRALKTKMRVANAPGTIDQGYRDEVGIIIDNIEPPIKDISYTFDDNGEIHITSIEHGRDMHIGKGEKICQLVIAEVVKAYWVNVDTVRDIGEDRGGGFGSSGLYAKDTGIHEVK